ncbi:TonB-dependent receptor [Arenibacter sp. 6A1]|uniref:TonB-dependent receptor n=1 Tax=Arenibacter sp. 6A1 TaxID=2720391 RepID=UPI0014476F91|nr:TonB-dependent receptor [Arenibacter sp. 6A1]NKI28501.1 TonB-dependent receptor [Arenibacter sp. 6A1]
MNKLLSPCLFICCAFCFSQNIDFDKLGKEKWLRYNGGISSNVVYYDGLANRQDITYYLTGNLNFNIAGLYQIPLSFTYSNQDFNFPNPFNYNRLSLHPSYKWATAHIGDVSMSFSPYSLSGHQFTGAGFDIAPEGKFKISGMYGRLLKATEYNEDAPNALTAYQRKGVGLKTSYDFDFMNLGIILFKAKDDINSLENPYPTSVGLSPKDNAVLSFESTFKVFDKAQIHLEYAISGITEDSRLTEKASKKGILAFLLEENISTKYYNAINASFDYPVGQGSMGVGYERIDPDYKTLGAYYFNNDLENITINANQNLFNDKVNLAVNAGLQQDNLNNAKSSNQQRIVSAINLNYNASERMGINASYSNFQSYTNIKDQFNYINQVSDFDNIDTLNYRQVSQTANLGINYLFKKTAHKQDGINFNIVYQNSDNQQEGNTIAGGKNAFYNGTASYTLTYPEEALQISLAANTSYNTIGDTDNSFTAGPTFTIGKQFFNKKLRTNLSSSYNKSYSNGTQQNQVFNIRLGGNYLWKQKHHFTLNILTLTRKTSLANASDLTATLGYRYTFDNLKLSLPRGQRNQKTNTSELLIKFRYRNVSYSGTIPEINRQLTSVFQSDSFENIPVFKKDELSILLATAKAQKKEIPYTQNALIFLNALYAYGDFQEVFNEAVFTVIEKLKSDMQKVDMALENLFVIKKLEADQHPLHNKQVSDYKEEDRQLRPQYDTLLAERQERLEKLVGHRWMEKEFTAFTSIDEIKQTTGLLKEFKDQQSTGCFKLYDKMQDINELEQYIEIQLIDFYYKKSLGIVNPDSFELIYINKK